MHRRAPSDHVSKRVFDVQQLPLSCMSRVWLRTLSAAEKEKYDFQPHQYDYTFPAELLRPPVGPTPQDVVLSDEEDM